MRYLIRMGARLEALSEIVARVVTWLLVAMVGLTVYDVVMRYVFRHGSVALQELEWHLFALVFLLGAASTLRQDAHVRVDLIYNSRCVSDRQRLLIDLFGNVLFLLPFCTLLIWTSVPFAFDSWAHAETSPDAGGLDHRWILKAAIPLGFGLLLLQGVANTIKGLARLLGKD